MFASGLSCFAACECCKMEDSKRNQGKTGIFDRKLMRTVHGQEKRCKIVRCVHVQCIDCPAYYSPGACKDLIKQDLTVPFVQGRNSHK